MQGLGVTLGQMNREIDDRMGWLIEKQKLHGTQCENERRNAGFLRQRPGEKHLDHRLGLTLVTKCGEHQSHDKAAVARIEPCHRRHGIDHRVEGDAVSDNPVERRECQAADTEACCALYHQAISPTGRGVMKLHGCRPFPRR